MSLAETFEHWLPLIEAEMLDIVTTAWPRMPQELRTMLLYHLGFADADGSAMRINAGKRIRPVLTLLSCQACNGDAQLALPAAAGIELLHNFSLIHDDIEDGDALRRGRPTLWKQWNTALAINAGDTMFALSHLAFQRCADRGAAPGDVLRALRVFDDTNVHLTVGQHWDISFETRTAVSVSQYLDMIAGKTAALTAAACGIGALIAGANAQTAEALSEFGRSLGLSFQLQDDVLGIWGDPAVTGKADGDLARRKKTLPVLFAAERDEVVRALYFGDSPLTTAQLGDLRNRIDASGARKHTEDAAASAYAKGAEALEALPDSASRATLHALAHSLLGRKA